MIPLIFGCQVPVKDIVKVLDPERVSATVQHFTDIYLHLPGFPSTGQFTESNCVRVRNCEGRFALLIREVNIFIKKYRSNVFL